MRNAYLSTLYDLAQKDEQVLALISDNGAIVYDKYREAFPKQYLNCGISEATMVSVAAGLASCGKVPFAYTIANFLTYRAYEQIRNDVCLQKMNVKLVGIGVGFVYSVLGPTHHSTEDIAVMRALPNMTIFSPCDPLEAKKVTQAAYEMEGPVYIRLATGGSPSVYTVDYDFQVGKAVTLRDGGDITVVSTGSGVAGLLEMIDEIKKEGINVRFLNYHTIKPFDRDAIIKSAKETGKILSVEEQNLNGGLGSAIAEVISEEGFGNIKFKRLGLNDQFSNGYGSYADLKDMNGVSPNKVKETILSMLGK